jgi:hypothetical protein
MQVILPESATLTNELENELKTYLERSQLKGIALMGFSFSQPGKRSLKEIDALLLVEPGRFFCIEAKNYSGKWTGDANLKWTNGEKEIESTKINPYQQTRAYSLLIKERLRMILKSDESWVYSLIVAPNHATFDIATAIVNDFNWTLKKASVVRFYPSGNAQNKPRNALD